MNKKNTIFVLLMIMGLQVAMPTSGMNPAPQVPIQSSSVVSTLIKAGAFFGVVGSIALAYKPVYRPYALQAYTYVCDGAAYVAERTTAAAAYVSRAAWSLPTLVKAGAVAAVGATMLAKSNLDTKTKIGIGVGVTVTAALTRFLYNYAGIRTLDKKRNLDHMCLGDRHDGPIKFYKWEVQNYPAARLIKANGAAIIQAFKTSAQNGTLYIPDLNGNSIAYPTWKHVRDAIDREKDEFWQDILQLERDHLVYCDVMPSLVDAFGIQREYDKACVDAPLNARGEHADPQGPGSWTEQQERSINLAMQNPWSNPTFLQRISKPIFTAIKPNYVYAAKTYWKILKIWQRLCELEKLLAQQQAGVFINPNRPQNGGIQAPVVVINNNQQGAPGGMPFVADSDERKN
ncbi:MAG: hypothetical protein NTX86_01905 [Candidatus Dependentiae bacterium]|nr:hypothetical protein [Candidatus Dependentiae bacterium]